MSNQIATSIRLVCSNRPRPQVQSSYAKWGGAGWNRDTHHASIDTGKPLYHGATTLCGSNCADWLIIETGPLSEAEALSYEGHDLCKHCAEKLTPR